MFTSSGRARAFILRIILPRCSHLLVQQAGDRVGCYVPRLATNEAKAFRSFTDRRNAFGEMDA
jgi:hypothetical protein